jgi:hypothetical protein
VAVPTQVTDRTGVVVHVVVRDEIRCRLLVAEGDRICVLNRPVVVDDRRLRDGAVPVTRPLPQQRRGSELNDLAVVVADVDPVVVDCRRGFDGSAERFGPDLGPSRQVDGIEDAVAATDEDGPVDDSGRGPHLFARRELPALRAVDGFQRIHVAVVRPEHDRAAGDRR